MARVLALGLHGAQQCIRAAPARQPLSKQIQLWCPDKGLLFHCNGRKKGKIVRLCHREYFWSKERKQLSLGPLVNNVYTVLRPDGMSLVHRLKEWHAGDTERPQPSFGKQLV